MSWTALQLPAIARTGHLSSAVSGVNSVAAYDLYCWYVAGLVGEGLTCLFVEAGLGEIALIDQGLYKLMCLFLQKTNIIRDVREGRDDGWCFWPKEIWSKHVGTSGDLFNTANRDLTLSCSSELIPDALRHDGGCLSYLAGLRKRSVFKFCAIPLCMSIATLELCFCNPVLFVRRIKISTGNARLD